MLEAYHKLFDIYLRILKKNYDPEKPYENLEECISLCQRFCWKLYGMIELLSVSECIDRETDEIESTRITQVFSTTRLFGAYEEAGEIRVFARGKSTMHEDPHDF